MKKILLATVVALFAISAHALPDVGGCEGKALSKDGKPLNGAAKASFMKKCEREAGGVNEKACEAKALSKDDKPLFGAAKAASVKKCLADSK